MGSESPSAFAMRVYPELAGRATPADRMQQLLDLYAPCDEDGERHPGDGVIDRATFLALLEMA